MISIATTWAKVEYHSCVFGPGVKTEVQVQRVSTSFSISVVTRCGTCRVPFAFSQNPT